MSTPAPAAGAPTLDSSDRDGPLPLLLLVMTFVTGLVDSVSYLALGHVFVGNMTGNILFLAFAVAGVKEFSVVASLIALGGFVFGALAGGLLGVRAGQHRGRLLAISICGKALLVGLALCVVLASTPLQPSAAYAVIALLAFAMGSQNAVVRRISVSDITTTVLTTTLTSLVADSHLAGGGAPRARRRIAAVAAMFIGAAIGAWLVFHDGAVLALSLALVVLIMDGIAAYRAAAQNAAWTSAGLR